MIGPDGVDYGMGYEVAPPGSERDSSVEFLNSNGVWVKRWEPVHYANTANDEVASFSEHRKYRRPLPIITSHHGAVPLEPGAELCEGENYLMRDGRESGPMPYDGHDAFPFGLDGTPDTWHKNGTCWRDCKSDNDIVAHIPKIETQTEKDAEAEKASDPLVAEVMQTLDRGGWNRDLAARIIEIVRAHDAKQKAGE